MAQFIIEGGHRLRGTITPVGNKNSALPLLAACLLTDQPLILGNIPDIGDVRTKLELLRQLGVHIETKGNSVYTLDARRVGANEPDLGLSQRIRTAPLLIGPLLARRGSVTVSRPGGDRIGKRSLHTHFLALEALGAHVEVVHGQYIVNSDGLRGADILLDEMSVTGTEQAIMAAVLAEGTTRIFNAASEPHVQDVCRCLQQMGAQIEGVGTNTLTIDGVRSLNGTTYHIGPDYMEVGSLIGLAAATRSEIRIAKARPFEHRITRIMFERIGVTWHDDGEDIVVPADQKLCVTSNSHTVIPKIESMPWPGFPTDLLSIAIVVATQTAGTVLIHEKMFENRLFFVDRLIAMGAGIVLCDPHRAIIVGPTPLHGETLVSPDIRAGMALLIAALAAEGTSTMQNVNQIDRGYERIEERLRGLGAHIKRVDG
jgi:UDP-N-acetylglucosamine 1-carboxyvinyltransferase